MKKVSLLVIPVLVLMVSCSKKTIPALSNFPKSAEKGNTVITVEPPPAGTVAAPTVAPLPATSTTLAFSKPMIVIDETGKIITERNQLPEEIASKVDYKKITRSFTPTQRQNLIYRFKMVPPKVLFVPDAMSKKTAKGNYAVFKKKFWYWKKEDGLYYLDETYYQ
jgi:hypothetical protein